MPELFIKINTYKKLSDILATHYFLVNQPNMIYERIHSETS
jgi:hypothetical protein